MDIRPLADELAESYQQLASSVTSAELEQANARLCRALRRAQESGFCVYFVECTDQLHVGLVQFRSEEQLAIDRTTATQQAHFDQMRRLRRDRWIIGNAERADRCELDELDAAWLRKIGIAWRRK